MGFLLLSLSLYLSLLLLLLGFESHCTASTGGGCHTVIVSSSRSSGTAQRRGKALSSWSGAVMVVAGCIAVGIWNRSITMARWSPRSSNYGAKKRRREHQEQPGRCRRGCVAGQES